MRYTYRKFQKRAKLAGFVGTGKLWLINQHDEWIHDVYEESDIHHGRIYTLEKAFHPLSTSISGYFHDTETNKWIRVVNGLAITKRDEEGLGNEGHGDHNDNCGWMDSLEAILEWERTRT